MKERARSQAKLRPPALAGALDGTLDGTWASVGRAKLTDMVIPADIAEILPPGRRFIKSVASQPRRTAAHGRLSSSEWNQHGGVKLARAKQRARRTARKNR